MGVKISNNLKKESATISIYADKESLDQINNDTMKAKQDRRARKLGLK